MHEVDRRQRVGELIHRQLAHLIAREVSDPRIRLVTITAVTVSKDLKQATVYVSSIDGSTSPSKVEQDLKKASKYLRYMLSQHVNLRVTPELNFRYDVSIRRAVEIVDLINSVNKRHVTH